MRRFEFHYETLEEPEGSGRRVFSDPKRTRRKWLQLHCAAVVSFFALWLVVFVQTLQPPSMEPVTRSSQSVLPLSEQTNDLVTPDTEVLLPAHATLPTCLPQNPPFAAMADGTGIKKVFAHVPVALDWAHLSLNSSCDVIDVLVPDWITLVETGHGLSVELVNTDTRQPVEDYLAGRATPIRLMPRVMVQPRIVNSGIDKALSDEATVASLVSDLRLSLHRIEADGVCLDVSQFPKQSDATLTTFFQSLRAALEVANLGSCLITGSTEDRPGIAKIAAGFQDVVVKLFYEPWLGSAPRPLGGNQWFIEAARQATAEFGAERVVFAMGAFGAKWEAGVPLPQRLPYAQALMEVADADATLSFNADTSGSYASYQNPQARRQTLWLQDAATAFNQLILLQEFGPVRVGVWSLGQEDPGLWHVLNGLTAGMDLNTTALREVRLDNYVAYTGAGPVLKVRDRGQVGARSFDVDPNSGLIANQSYQALPVPHKVERFGQLAPNELVLTFDDGPHPEFTPQVLDILAETDTPAVFFALGQNVMNHPDILRDTFSDGHEIGAHSFSHPRMDKISPARTHVEHTLTDRVIASAIGHGTLLYREPFLRSGGPIQGSRVGPLASVQARGQINFGMDIVPKDWTGMTSDDIADYVLAQVEQGAGNVILLHDGGGADRSATVQALPRMINELKARGYVFVTAAETLRISREDLMPDVKGVQTIFDKVSFAFASNTLNGLALVFWIVLVIGLGRSALILLLALRRRRHSAPQIGPHPKVAVVIPAFNEEAAISNTIESVLASTYPWLEVVVVDDGSTDRTLNEVLAFAHEPKLRLISHPNQGKWSALNRAITALDADIAVCIDADTQVAPDAISHLVTHFQNPRVGAVAGKIVVGNQVNLLTRMQALEYVTAQNFERRAFDRINGIFVVPGAIGAWRVKALRRAGLFRPDTITEDSDMTVSVNRAGYRVVYEDRAVAYTEAPRRLPGLMAQRLRWSLGMFQTAWKHKWAALQGRMVGFASIPDMLIFGYLFPLLAPLADLFVLILLYNLLVGGWSGEVGDAAPLVAPELMWAYLVLPVLEFGIATFAVLTDPTAPKRLILYWPFQRVFYRPLLYLTVFRAILRALSGTLASWGRSKRYGGDLMGKTQSS